MNMNQPQGPFCQSCSMPMVKKEDFGTNADGTHSTEYCHYCYKDGKFTDGGATMDQVIEKSVGAMRQMNMPEALIDQTKKVIPNLKRWKK